MNIGWRMEREEAIFENENNSNLESESNNRQHAISARENEEDLGIQAEEEEDERADIRSVHHHEISATDTEISRCEESLVNMTDDDPNENYEEDGNIQGGKMTSQNDREINETVTSESVHGESVERNESDQCLVGKPIDLVVSEKIKEEEIVQSTSIDAAAEEDYDLIPEENLSELKRQHQKINEETSGNVKEIHASSSDSLNALLPKDESSVEESEQKDLDNDGTGNIDFGKVISVEDSKSSSIDEDDLLGDVGKELEEMASDTISPEIKQTSDTDNIAQSVQKDVPVQDNETSSVDPISVSQDAVSSKDFEIDNFNSNSYGIASEPSSQRNESSPHQQSPETISVQFPHRTQDGMEVDELDKDVNVEKSVEMSPDKEVTEIVQEEGNNYVVKIKIDDKDKEASRMVLDHDDTDLQVISPEVERKHDACQSSDKLKESRDPTENTDIDKPEKLDRTENIKKTDEITNTSGDIDNSEDFEITTELRDHHEEMENIKESMEKSDELENTPEGIDQPEELEITQKNMDIPQESENAIKAMVKSEDLENTNEDIDKTKDLKRTTENIYKIDKLDDTTESIDRTTDEDMEEAGIDQSAKERLIAIEDAGKSVSQFEMEMEVDKEQPSSKESSKSSKTVTKEENSAVKMTENQCKSSYVEETDDEKENKLSDIGIITEVHTVQSDEVLSLEENVEVVSDSNDSDVDQSNKSKKLGKSGIVREETTEGSEVNVLISESSQGSNTKEIPSGKSDLIPVKASSVDDDNDDDVIVMQEIKKEDASSDYKMPETITREVKEDEAVNATKLKTEVIVLDDEQDIKATDDAKASEAGLGIQIAAVSGQQHQLHANACDGSVSSLFLDSEDCVKTNNKSPSKSKTQTCIVCQNITRCKYNIVRNGDTKQLCGDVCFKKFRDNPNRYLKKEKTTKDDTSTSQPLASNASTQSLANILPKTSSSQPMSPSSAKSSDALGSAQYKTCHICQVMNNNAPQKFCNWKGLDFCGESCLAKFQATLSTTCSHCTAYIPIDMRASFCLKIGNEMRPFCKQRCYQEFKKNLRMCSYCQRDLLTIGSVIAKVGVDPKSKEFCSYACVKKFEGECDDVQIVNVQISKSSENATCSVCKVQGRAVKHAVRYQSKTFSLCSDICLSAFQYTNKINVNKCDSCNMVCTSIEAQVHFIQFEGTTKRFCSDKCVHNFRTANRKVMECSWCGAKKTNFDMIERLDEDNKFQLFCSLNCLSLYRVNLQAKSNTAVSCDQCKKVVPAQYHLTMSDASVRNFCSYGCVMTFQSQFTQKAIPQRKPQQPPPPTPVVQQTVPAHRHGTRSKGRSKSATKTDAVTQDSSTSSSPLPVISDVVSLASDEASDKNYQAMGTAASIVQTLQKKGSLFTGDGKDRILIRAPSPTTYKNRSLQCRPITQTKATSCRPHSQNKEVQTEKDPVKPVIVPIPVPIYVPMPTVMYSTPILVPMPIPIPIPVPIFIPTTRKSTKGVMRTIKEIVDRIPADPLEAELLMMAEAVASDRKRPGDSDTDSEQDVDTNDYEDVDDSVLPPPPPIKGTNSLVTRKREGAGEEDMIQMALRMAEEMSGPIEDLESSVEPSVVNSEPTHQSEIDQMQVYNNRQMDADYSPPKTGRGRGSKRPSRGRPPSNSRSKRQKMGNSSYAEGDVDTAPLVPVPQIAEPPPDHNLRLKFTFGVNAWKNWVIGKNTEIEKSRQAGKTKMRPLPTDILRCTMDELNYSLCLFIKEVRKPNGEIYSPDSVYYLCLGMQQYLYENGRIDNIFTDLYFQRFTDALHELLKSLQPKVNSQGQMLCRIEEEHLWESKQLGAHSPYILLNTLIYFHTKHFILKTASEHMHLSFAQILKHLKKGVPVKAGSGQAGKNVSLRFYCLANKKDPSLAARKNKDGVPVFEVTENFVNPLRCPVKLYEFFLSKCPESIKNRNDIFYPVPERSCVPDSPVWYSTQSIDVNTMDKMLTRVLLVREIQEAHLHAQAIYI